MKVKPCDKKTEHYSLNHDAPITFTTNSDDELDELMDCRNVSQMMIVLSQNFPARKWCKLRYEK